MSTRKNLLLGLVAAAVLAGSVLLSSGLLGDSSAVKTAQRLISQNPGGEPQQDASPAEGLPAEREHPALDSPASQRLSASPEFEASPENGAPPDPRSSPTKTSGRKPRPSRTVRGQDPKETDEPADAGTGDGKVRVPGSRARRPGG